MTQLPIFSNTTPNETLIFRIIIKQRPGERGGEAPQLARDWKWTFLPHAVTFLEEPKHLTGILIYSVVELAS